MDYLLDTNALVFFLQDSPRLHTELAEMMERDEAVNYVSLASLWEISLKFSLGKLQVDYGDHPDLPGLLSSLGFEILPISWPAMRRASSLPRLHGDPFDRLLVAECQLRQLPIISADSKLDGYGIERLWR